MSLQQCQILAFHLQHLNMMNGEILIIKMSTFYMKQYSPYDNIKELNYPAVFVTSSLFDSQVQYFEPAKYVPKLRDYSQSKNPILMKMNLIGGHGGLSGKINQFNEVAEEYNFIINLLE